LLLRLTAISGTLSVKIVLKNHEGENDGRYICQVERRTIYQ
jgi:hypothetical protein